MSPRSPEERSPLSLAPPSLLWLSPPLSSLPPAPSRLPHRHSQESRLQLLLAFFFGLTLLFLLLLVGLKLAYKGAVKKAKVQREMEEKAPLWKRPSDAHLNYLGKHGAGGEDDWVLPEGDAAAVMAGMIGEEEEGDGDAGMISVSKAEKQQIAQAQKESGSAVGGKGYDWV